MVKKYFPDEFENLLSEMETHVSEWLPDHKQDKFYKLLHELTCRYELDKWVEEE